MKSTGKIRKIDRLGRVVIPKEMLRTLHVRENDPLEVYLAENEIIVRKHIIEKDDDKEMIIFENAKTVLEKNELRYGKDFCIYRILEPIKKLSSKSVFPDSIPDELKKWNDTKPHPIMKRYKRINEETNKEELLYFIPIFCEGLEGFISFVDPSDSVLSYIGGVAAMLEEVLETAYQLKEEYKNE